MGENDRKLEIENPHFREILLFSLLAIGIFGIFYLPQYLPQILNWLIVVGSLTALIILALFFSLIFCLRGRISKKVTGVISFVLGYILTMVLSLVYFDIYPGGFHRSMFGIWFIFGMRIFIPGGIAVAGLILFLCYICEESKGAG